MDVRYQFDTKVVIAIRESIQDDVEHFCGCTKIQQVSKTTIDFNRRTSRGRRE
jgi:hypothetical protein